MFLYSVWVSERLGDLWRHRLVGLFTSPTEAEGARERALTDGGLAPAAGSVFKEWPDRIEWGTGFVSPGGRVGEWPPVAPRPNLRFVWLEREKVTTIFYLWHEYGEGRILDTEKALGVYTAAKHVLEAVRTLAPMPGFCDFPDGFRCAELALGRSYGSESPVKFWDDEPLDNSGP